MKAVRLSNIELLRMIAMFMIIAVHADYWLFGIPTSIESVFTPISSFTRIMIEQLTVVGPNIFVLISGYFAIRPSIKSFLTLIFQILFFHGGVYLIGVSCDLMDFSLKSFASIFLFTKSDWFIKAYIALLIIAPLLNVFVEYASRKQLKVTLILFFLFQSIYGWSGSAVWFEQGYSAFSFIGLYLLARYIRLYKPYLHLCTINSGLFIYFLSAVICSLIAYLGCRYNIMSIPGFMMAYANPLVILGSVALLYSFSSLTIQNTIINKIGKSTFAVYLFPCYFIFDITYKHLLVNIYNQYNGLTVIGFIGTVLIIIFTISIFIDQIRIIIWNLIWPPLEKLMNKSIQKIHI